MTVLLFYSPRSAAFPYSLWRSPDLSSSGLLASWYDKLSRLFCYGWRILQLLARSYWPSEFSNLAHIWSCNQGDTNNCRPRGAVLGIFYLLGASLIHCDETRAKRSFLFLHGQRVLSSGSVIVFLEIPVRDVFITFFSLLTLVLDLLDPARFAAGTATDRSLACCSS